MALGLVYRLGFGGGRLGFQVLGCGNYGPGFNACGFQGLGVRTLGL